MDIIAQTKVLSSDGGITVSKPPKFCYFFRLVLKKSNVWRVAVMVSERIANPSYR